MIKKIVSVIFLSTLIWMCSDKYNDEIIKRDIAEIGEVLTELEKQVAELNSQLTAISELVSSNFIAMISIDADGKYIISYSDGSNETKTIRLALYDDAVNSPVISAGLDEDEIYYWRTTTDNGQTYQWLLNNDGGKIPVTGYTPKLEVDADGNWTINGELLTNDEGNPVTAHDLTNSLFSSVKIADETGEAIFALTDGTEIRCRMYEALRIEFDCPVYTAIADRSQSVRIRYNITGTEAEDAIVDYFTAYNVTVTVDNSISTIIVRLNDNAESGNIVIMAYANGNTVLKPLFFTYGEAVIDEPELDHEYGSGGEIILTGELTSFEIKVSANIEYEINVGEEARSWLNYNDPSVTRAAMVTQSHVFIADYYDNESGAIRTGTIMFANRLYDISTTVIVKQTPSAHTGQGGISTASDLIAFAAAVNAGASTTRWQNDAGIVILNNDIDMSSVSEWTPAGSATGSYTTVYPFTGTLDGQGFAIYNINWTFTVGGTSNYAFGLFGSIKDAAIRNLTLGAGQGTDRFTIAGTAGSSTTIGAIAGYSENSSIENCTNYVNLNFSGENPAGILVSLGGIAGTMNGGTIGGSSRSLGCINYGTVATGKISNEGNGATGMTVGGICAFMQNNTSNHIIYCVNYGNVSAPTGRGGGLVGTSLNGKISNSDNRGLIQDDIVGQYSGKPIELTYNNKRMGGLVGGAGNNNIIIEYCTNYGNVFSSLGCRTGGFVGHNQARITGCVNRGVILADLYVEGNGTNRHGPGWACGYSQASASGTDTGRYINVQGCAKGGHVGEYSTYKNNPTSAPEATDDNAFCHASQNYDPSINN